MRLLFQILKEIKNYQSVAFDFPQTDLFQKLQSQDYLDEQSLFTLSLKCEAKDSKKETIMTNPMHKSPPSPRKPSTIAVETPKVHYVEEEEEHNYREEIPRPNSPEPKGNENGDSKEVMEGKVGTLLFEEDFSDLESVLGSKKSCKVFEQWLIEKNAKHLLDFLQEVETFEHLDDPINVASKALEIYEKYFTQSKYRVNVEEDIREQLAENAILGIFSVDSYHLAEASVFFLLDTVYFPLFLQSNIYESTIQESNEEK